MGRTLADVLLDSGLRLRLERAGPRRARWLSWERAARLTLDAYYEVAGAAPPWEVAQHARAAS
jgi:hypothetical protein